MLRQFDSRNIKSGSMTETLFRDFGNGTQTEHLLCHGSLGSSNWLRITPNPQGGPVKSGFFSLLLHTIDTRQRCAAGPSSETRLWDISVPNIRSCRTYCTRKAVVSARNFVYLYTYSVRYDRTILTKQWPFRYSPLILCLNRLLRLMLTESQNFYQPRLDVSSVPSDEITCA